MTAEALSRRRLGGEQSVEMRREEGASFEEEEGTRGRERCREEMQKGKRREEVGMEGDGNRRRTGEG